MPLVHLAHLRQATAAEHQQLEQLPALRLLLTDQQTACQAAIDTFRFFRQQLLNIQPIHAKILEKQP
ncbi:hypothetical protein [Marinospirillum alkaliphilum]|uniref:Uncharacterized protein n=1 Tax=Marinospirillum alkaliphilum DSM 21637 TaxID=1122209 RepID=A0A1K1UAF9_9GAMM|nr:hypothetical protein [Marinospirillum alkaliphilum]SFX09596.1 hypothetical protein SAMN02745752_00519 [Marinospirillum alkaliphilum DSM 21637]